MGKLLRFFKISLIVVFLGWSFFLLYLLFLQPRERRFTLAAHSQGSELSQSLFDYILQRDPNYDRAYFEQSVPYNKRGDFFMGFTLLDKAVAMDPKAHLGYRGWLKYDFLRDNKGCIEDLKRLDSLTPEVVDAPWGMNIHYLLGLAHKDMGDYQGALEAFEKYLETEQDTSWVDPDMFLQRGIIHSDLGQWEQAIENFDLCQRFNDNRSPEAYFYKARVLVGTGQGKQAMELLERALELFQKGYGRSDAYVEVQGQIYLPQIEREIAALKATLD